MPQLELAMPSGELIDLVVEHQGIVSYRALLQRFPRAEVERWIQERVLIPQGMGQYTLHQLEAYVDGLVLCQWAVPGGVVGKLSALVFHGLSVALPKLVDMVLPPDWQGNLPPDLGIRPFEVPAALRDYGVMEVFPTPPGTAPVKMYSPAVALAQVWADQRMLEEPKLDGLMMYQAFLNDEAALQEAFDRYGVRLPPVLTLT